MLSHGDRAGFDAWVETSDGRRLNFHQIKHTDPVSAEDAGTCEAFVECEEGSEFRIKVNYFAKPVARQWSVLYEIDGHSLRNALHADTSQESSCGNIYEEQEGKVYSRPLRFDGLSRSSLSTEGTLSKEYGTISVTIRSGTRTNPVAKQRWKSTTLNTKLHEKAAKFGSTVTGGDKVLNEEVTTLWDFDFDPNQEVYYRFTWKYRTGTKLMQMGIIEEPTIHSPPEPSRKRVRSPTPPPVAAEEASQILENDEKSGIVILSAQAKRLKYLEVQVKKLNEQLKNGSQGQGDHGVVDLSLDSD